MSEIYVVMAGDKPWTGHGYYTERVRAFKDIGTANKSLGQGKRTTRWQEHGPATHVQKFIPVEPEQMELSFEDGEETT